MNKTKIMRNSFPLAIYLVPLVFLIIFFAIPIVQMLVYSFYEHDVIGFIVPVFTLKNYINIIFDEYLRSIVLRTLSLSIAATAISIFIAFPLAIRLLYAGQVERNIILIIVISPIMISPVILAYPWLVILAPNTGLVAQVLNAFGISGVSLMYTNTGVLIGLVYAEMVFMVLSIHAALTNIDSSTVIAARVFGANRMQAFLRVTLPLSLPGIASGSMLVFSVSISSFMMPYLLGGRQVPVMATYAYDMASVLLNWPSAAAMAGVLIVITIGSLLIYSSWISRLERRLGFQ